MRTHLFLLLMIFSFTLSKAQWVEIDPGVDNALYDIYAITPDIVVAVGDNGTIIKTIDGGETWQQKESGTSNRLTKLQFPTSDIGYIIGGGGIFLKTIDSGETWFSITAGPDCFYQDMSCVDENLIFVICNGILMKSTDGGENWNEIGSIPGNNFQFLSDEIGFMMTLSQGLFRTENGGEDWIKLDIYYTLFQFLDENVGFLYSAGLAKSIDGGYNFEFLGGEFGDWFSYFYVENENRTWGILEPIFDGDGTTRGILKSEILTDGSYAEEVCFDNDNTVEMYSIHFANENTGYIAGYNYAKGIVWKNSTGINTMSTAEQVETAKIKVYPNPASDVLNIDLGKTFTEIKVSLSDVSGKQFISETHKQKDKLSIHTQTLPKGVYVLSIQTSQHMFNKKIIIN